MAEPISVTDAEFDEKVLQSDVPVLVDFWAEWCGPCKMIAPVLKQIAADNEGQLTIAKVDVDVNQAVAARFGISGIPTMILFKGGEVVDRIVGFVPKAQLLNRLAKNVEGVGVAR
ncbi:MAG: thioredoxin [Chloroflexi bacterium]|nr:thioredoxin [Chloroflexota bacterium]